MVILFLNGEGILKLTRVFAHLFSARICPRFIHDDRAYLMSRSGVLVPALHVLRNVHHTPPASLVRLYLLLSR